MRIFGIEIGSAKQSDQIRENLQDLERKLEDLGWVSMSGQTGLSQTLARESYVRMVQRSRLAWIKSPAVGQAINIITTYTFGEGITKPKAKDPEVQEFIDRFWNDPDNRLTFTKPQSQVKASNKLVYDGELCFVMQPDPDGSTYISLVDPLSIVDVIVDKNNAMRTLFYKRQFGSVTQYVADWQNAAALRRESDGAEEFAKQLKDYSIPAENVIEDAYIYHVKINNDALDKRGVPMVYRALDWVNSHSGISSDMSSFIRAQSQYALKKKIKGSKSQVEAMRTRYAQNTQLTNPARGAGSTIMENELVENSAIELKPGSGQLFEVGIRRSLLMVCAAFGLMEHYFGDPSTGNLATATAMELPMLKAFKANQKMWEGIVLDLLGWELDRRLEARSTAALEYNPTKNRLYVRQGMDFDRTIDVDFPPILEVDIKALAEGLGTAKSKQLIPTETAQRLFMQGCGVNNIDDEMKKEFDEPIAFDPGIGGGAFGAGAPNREAGVATSGFSTRRNPAVRLADKNRRVIARMNGYARELGGVFKKFTTEAANSATFHMVQGDIVNGGRTSNEKWKIKEIAVEKSAKILEDGMLKLAGRYIPEAVAFGESYVKSRALKEGRITEALGHSFVKGQMDWNEGYVTESLGPDVRRKLTALMGEEFESEAAAKKAVREASQAFAKRVGSYAGAFWTVEERAVKQAAREAGGMEANFVGVEDSKNCPGCEAAIAGNPWTAETVPTPGDQECLGECRHAIQLVGDEALSESDIKLLKDAEADAKRGFLLFEESRGS